MKQTQALAILLDGKSVFLTGSPGAGKTYVLNQFIKRARRAGKTIAVTASTGIAATHIGGTTIHSWSGLGIREFLTSRDRQQLAGNARLVKRYNAANVLVIDEVSMLHGKRLDMVNEACKLLRKSDEPFGGLQIVLVGDLFQLPPISRGTDVLDFVHLADAWQELNPAICYLSEQHRQEEDGLLELLVAMRGGDVEALHEEMLQKRLGTRPADGQQVTRLYAHNVDIDTVNQRHLSAIANKSHEYTMTTKGSAAKVEQLRRSVLAPEQLELKAGAEVMFVANNPASGFSNGTRGQVVDFRDELPVVALADGGRRIKVTPHSWKFEEDDRVRAEVSQLPLRLAWAITIHKSQGMSLDAAEIDLGKSFSPGMGYVALSRVRSLDGLFLSGINRVAMQMHQEIYELDRRLKAASKALATVTLDVEPEPAAEIETDDKPVPNQSLLSDLKAWRLKQAQADSVPAFVIAHDSMLESIAISLPRSEQALLGVKGLGPRKIESFGTELIKIVSPHIPAETPNAVEVPESMGMTDRPSSAEIIARRQELVAEYPRAFKRWQPEEESLLLDLFEQAFPLEWTCAVLERQPSAVWARLHQLLLDKS